MTKKEKEAEREEARKVLRDLLKPGDVVYTDLASVSSSGMTRHIKIILIRKNEPRFIGWHVSRLLDMRLDERGAVIVGGCGMDMGFHIVYNMGRELWPNGFTCAGVKRCRSNDHSNGDRDYSKHTHNDGGYALVQRWL